MRAHYEGCACDTCLCRPSAPCGRCDQCADVTALSPLHSPADLHISSNGDKGDKGDKGKRRTSWTAAELLDAEFPEPRWAVPGILAEGLSFLVGAPKVGKSWMGLGLGIAVASGGVALGRIDVQQGPALYLGLEDTPRRLKDRLVKLLAGSAPPADLTISIECEPMPEGRERISRWLTSHPKARLVVVDVLARVRGTAFQGEGLYAADYRAASELKAIADDHGVPVLVLHHPRKMAAEDFVDAVSGTAGLAGAADSIALLKRTRGAVDAILSVTGRDIDEAEYALRFAADLGAWQLSDTPAALAKLGDTQRTIITWVAENADGDDGVGPKAIAEGTGLNHDLVKQTVRRMARENDLITDGHGHYWAPVTRVTDVTIPGQRVDGDVTAVSPDVTLFGDGWQPPSDADVAGWEADYPEEAAS